MTFKEVQDFLSTHELNRDERLFLFNYFNKQINAFPLEDSVKLTPDGLIVANGRAMTLEQREAFINGAHSLANNYAFKLILDQIMYQSLKYGLQNFTEMDHLHYGKAAMYLVDELKRYVGNLEQFN